MGTRQRTAIVAIAAAAAVLTAFVLSVLWTREKPPADGEAGPPVVEAPAEEDKPNGEKPVMEIGEAQLERRTEDGELEWRITVDGDFVVDKQTETVTATKIRFELVDEKQNPLVIEAQELFADYNSGRLAFDKGVKGQLTDGTGTFSVPRMEYEMGTKKLIGTGGVRFERGVYIMSSDRIVVDTVQQEVRMSGGVKFVKRG